MSINEHTGDRLVTKELSEEGKKNWDVIFGKKDKECECTHWVAGWDYKENTTNKIEEPYND